MIKLVIQLLTANLFISIFYQLRPFCDKVTQGAPGFRAILYGLGLALLLLNLLSTYTMFLLLNKKKVKRKKVKVLSISTFLMTILFLISFFDNHIYDCLTLTFPLLLINGLAIIFAYSHRPYENSASENKMMEN